MNLILKMKVEMLMNNKIDHTIKLKVVLIILCIGIFFIIFARNVSLRISTQADVSGYVKLEDNNEHITRAEVAKMLSLLQYSKDELAGLGRTIAYEDTDAEQWFDKYINAISYMGLFEGEEETMSTVFHPQSTLTYGSCGVILNNISSKKQIDIIKDMSFVIDEKKADEPILLTEWLEIYDLLINKVYKEADNTATGKEQVELKELYLVGTPTNLSTLSAWEALTDQGIYSYEGLDLEGNLDDKIKAYVKGNEIICVKDVLDTQVTLSNVWIIGNEGEEISVFVNGATRTFQAVSSVTEDINQVVGDLVIEDKKVIKVNIKPEKITGKVLVANDEYIELEEYGKIYLEDNYKIYRIYDELMMELTSGIVVGYNTTDFVVSGGKICAALIKDAIVAKDIRVLIKSNGFKDMYHEKVQITADTDFIIYYGEKKNSYKAGKKITIKSNSKIIKSGRIRVETQGAGGKITILSLERSSGNPSYRGTIEVATSEEGMTIINELPLEEYLYAVVPSEMPVSYGLEALKVQAICARSYAYNHLMLNSWSEYGAHVDDSTTYQVYNNYPEETDSIQAVNDTSGKVIEYGGEVIFAYYFSTSCGFTADVDNVWLNNQSIPYLKGKYQGVDEAAGVDFSDESKFREFLSNAEIATYDKDYAWYRWNVSIDFSNLKKMVDETLSDSYEKKPEYVQTLDKDGKYKSAPINTVGDIKSIKVSQRETSGLVSEIIIEGSLNTVKVKSETNIRKILTPSYDTLIRQDHSEIKTLSLLPSSFLVFDDILTDKAVTGVKISGGGFGHGVGMSQNGVKTMTSLGKTYEEIIKHYYDGTEVSYIY